MIISLHSFSFSVGYPIMSTFLPHLKVVGLLSAVFQGKSQAEDQMEKLKEFYFFQ